jgi:aminoglycoside phosphotransferase (APT) family kinase protein
MPGSLTGLLHHLSAIPQLTWYTWQEWVITPILGNANNRLYRVTSVEGDYAVKFTVRDSRNRAQREYAALCALQNAGLALAPRAVRFDDQGCSLPVVVQTWLEGDVFTAPPGSDEDWDALLGALCQVHSLTPVRTSMPIMDAVHNVSSGADGKAFVAKLLGRLPIGEQPASLRGLLSRFERWNPPAKEPRSRALIHGDLNWRNLIRRSKSLALVDWENSGWGDPAFELADLATHPAYADVADAQWEDLIVKYAQRMGNPELVQRVATYTTIWLVWWAVRWACYLYEVPSGLDRRLVAFPPEWLATAPHNYQRCLEKAEQQLDKQL